MRRLCLVLLLLAAPLAQAEEALLLNARGTIQLAFTPGDDVAGLIVAAIGKARRQVLVQTYSFTHQDIAQALVNHLQFEQHPHRWLIGRGDDAGHQYRRASGRRHFDFLSTVAPLFIHDFAQHAPERFVRQHVGHCTANQAAYAGLEQIFGG